MFGDVKGEIDNRKSNRVQTLQWPKGKKHNDLRSITQKLNVEQQKNNRKTGGEPNQSYVTC